MIETGIDGMDDDLFGGISLAMLIAVGVAVAVVLGCILIIVLVACGKKNKGTVDIEDEA